MATEVAEEHTATQVPRNERTAMAQQVTRQPDGAGKRIGKRGELTGIGQVAPGGAELFRQRLPQIQAEAAYWEGRVGTVHDIRVFLFDNDTRICFTLTYDGDFKPYLADFINNAAPWLDEMFLGVVEGFKGTKDPGLVDFLLTLVVEADLFYVSNPEVTCRDLERMQRLSSAVSDMLDAAS